MEVLRKVIQIPNTKEHISLVPLGDVHVGSSSCDEQAFVNAVQAVASSPSTYTILMGDLAECILPDDKRFDASEVAPWLWAKGKNTRLVDAQYDWVKAHLQTIPPSRILGALRGNHENTIKTKHYRVLKHHLH